MLKFSSKVVQDECLVELTVSALTCMPAPVASCVTKVGWWQKADNGLQWWMMTLVTLSGLRRDR